MGEGMRLDRLREQLNGLAGDIREWDAERWRISHKENHEGGAFSEWHGSDDRAVAIVRQVQDILGESARARPVKICPPGDECEDCAAIDG
ncbi:hypothetical protein [Actinomadura miaoliensis]|uniref:Uncharacterized protein n=1 Tax=Actinomadura miaoliensis TaxID=430685 RepID=A0ABP7X0P5_9ACTN